MSSFHNSYFHNTEKITPLQNSNAQQLHLSPIGLGTVKFGRHQQVKYPEAFALPTDQEIIELLAIAQDLGINHIDTAPAYGTSEARLGKLLKQRERWIISSKTGETFNQGMSQYNFTPEFTISSVKNSLKQLKTDYIDMIFVHSDGSDAMIIQHYGTLNALASLKQAGLIRSYGLSVKDPLSAIASLPDCETIMVEYHPGMAQNQQLATEQLLRQATAYQTLVCVKKALISGHLDQIPTDNGTDTNPDTKQNANPIETSMEFIFANPAIKNVTIGSINPNHLKENVQAYHRAINRMKNKQNL